MKAIVHTSYGPPDVLRLKEVAKPAKPGSGEVLLRVHASAVDPGVWHVTAGLPYLIRATPYGLRGSKPRVRGMDAAGVVEAVGPGVTRFRPGDEVYGTCDGAFAEYACVKQDQLASKPSGLDFAEAAAIPVSGCAALQALRDAGRVRAEQRVLVIGASGGVGGFAVQLAKAFGAHVTGVCGSAGADMVRSLGADEVLDYTREDPTDGTRRYDLVLDIAGNRPLHRLRRALTPRGTLVIVGGESGGRWAGGMGRTLRAMMLSPFVGQRLVGLISSQTHGDLRLLAELVEAGTVKPVVHRTYPLADVPDAIRHLRGGQVPGKITIHL
ncbi:NAD(P)-dependent alcohol dehydrogenase [Streptomyces sp. A1136]|uniref:NAD(P)-dependent alcohol dehydrogenase n=1 Tax=Streptomyces sp. A1136 TaxID=2563102 RepID=UPI00109EBB1D|nr:NAD(P)-dependent alcohol dehydrogenase [Streptomyces sp. A1136]THA47737.1 NAD(P)-dependent alcohol dehydrogenase [Streptomyces sp. A1136]